MLSPASIAPRQPYETIMSAAQFCATSHFRKTRLEKTSPDAQLALVEAIMEQRYQELLAELSVLPYIDIVNEKFRQEMQQRLTIAVKVTETVPKRRATECCFVGGNRATLR